MKKSEIMKNLMPTFYELKDKVQNKEGLSKEETKELYKKIFYIVQQLGL